MSTLRQLGERELIRRLARLVPGRGDVTVGIGDDVAVVHLEERDWDLLLTSDAVVEGVHFLPGTPAEKIGHKAVGRVLSDLAAMGGEPMWALVDLVAPPSLPVARIEKLYRGAARLADKYGLAIVGGDTSRGPVLEMHLFGVGRVPKGAAVLRSGARPGDVIYVTGSLGGSLGAKHLDFEPRLEEGLWLREQRWAHAMIDISDGLATDLGHLLEMSRVGAEVWGPDVPIAPAAKRMRDRRTPLDRALNDGEDFELLFTVSPEKRAAFESSWQEVFDLPCTAIGRVTKPRGRLTLVDAQGRRVPLREAGYDQFRR